jgi:hypothetical protein
LPDRHEDPARALRAYWTLDHLAGVWRLELRALFASFVAIRMILIGNRLLRDLWRRDGKVWRRAADRHTTSCTDGVAQKRAPTKRGRPRIHGTPRLNALEDRRFEPYDSVPAGLFHAPLYRDRQESNFRNKSGARKVLTIAISGGFHWQDVMN